MNLNTLMFAIPLLAGTVALVVGWELAGRRTRLAGQARSRLQQAETPILQESALEQLPAGSLERKLLEAGWKLSPFQFRLVSILLGLGGAAFAWSFFLPGIPAVAIGLLLAWVPQLALNERALGRGLRMDEHLPLALSRLAAGLQAGRGLDEVLEKVGRSLPEGSPLTVEFIKTAQDIRTGDSQEAMQKLALRAASPSLANVAMLLESYLRAGGGQYAGVVSDAAVQIQRVVSVRNHARAKASQALQSARLIPLIMLGVLAMMASDPATAESFRTGTVQIVIAFTMGVMLLGFLQMRAQIRKVV